jgi:hypothetical protein
MSYPRAFAFIRGHSFLSFCHDCARMHSNVHPACSLTLNSNPIDAMVLNSELPP